MSNKTIYPFGVDGELPASIPLVNDLTTGGADNALAAQQGVVLREAIGDGFFSNVEGIDLSGLTEQDCTLGTSKWYRGGTPVHGKHIAVPVTPGSIYRVNIKGTTSSGSFYTFVTSSYNPPYVNNDPIPFAGSETERSWVNLSDCPIVLTAPSNASYLILVTEDGSGAVTSWSVDKFISGGSNKSVEERITDDEKSAPGKIRILFWNVGHFALGASYDTAITQEQFPDMRDKWRNRLNTVGADIVLTCEYNTNFVNASGGNPAVTARDAVFASSVWKYAAVGTKPSATSYMQTAMFSNVELSAVSQVVYPNTVQAGRYYQVATILVGGHPVKLVATHLDFNQGEYGATYRAQQIQKLISDFADDERVIIGADFNVAQASEFDAFANAGYNMLNHGYMGNLLTYPCDDPTYSFDNIICKGFNISRVDVLEDDNKEFSDHCAIVADFTPLA